jgi:hypothetical protein
MKKKAVYAVVGGYKLAAIVWWSGYTHRDFVLASRLS